jgi:hypothetical protein
MEIAGAELVSFKNNGVGLDASIIPNPVLLITASMRKKHIVRNVVFRNCILISGLVSFVTPGPQASNGSGLSCGASFATSATSF